MLINKKAGKCGSWNLSLLFEKRPISSNELYRLLMMMIYMSSKILHLHLNTYHPNKIFPLISPLSLFTCVSQKSQERYWNCSTISFFYFKQSFICLKINHAEYRWYRTWKTTFGFQTMLNQLRRSITHKSSIYTSINCTHNTTVKLTLVLFSNIRTQFQTACTLSVTINRT